MALENVGNGVNLNLAGMFEPTLPDGSFELIFEKKLIPAGEIGSKLPFGLVLFNWDLLFIWIIVWNIHNLLYIDI